MNTSQKSDADQAFLLPSNVCDQKPDGAVTPSDPPAKALERNRKPTAQEVWDALLEDAIQDEIDRVIALSPEELDQQLREAGFDVDQLRPHGSDMYQELLSSLGQPADPAIESTSASTPPTLAAHACDEGHPPSAADPRTKPDR